MDSIKIEQNRPDQTRSGIQLFSFWTLSIILFLFKTQRFGDWILSLCLQVKPTQSIKLVHISEPPHPISQPSLDISPIWTPIIAAEVRKLQLCPV
jgi:hypothetical protein